MESTQAAWTFVSTRLRYAVARALNGILNFETTSWCSLCSGTISGGEVGWIRNGSSPEGLLWCVAGTSSHSGHSSRRNVCNQASASHTKDKGERMYLPLQTLGIPGWIRRVRWSMDTKTRIHNWRRTGRGQIRSRIRLKRKSSEEPTNWCRHWYPRFTWRHVFARVSSVFEAARTNFGKGSTGNGFRIDTLRFVDRLHTRRRLANTNTMDKMDEMRLKTLKQMKEEFVSNLSGGSIAEINTVTAVALVLCFLWKSNWQP